MTETLLFDLDGTLTDPRDGITRCICQALETLEMPCPSEEALLSWIGPPLQRSFREHLGEENAHLVPAAMSAYRERFVRVGMFENAVYPGITEALFALRHCGWTLFVATAKPTVFAERILEHFGLRKHFTNVYGSELSGQHSDKGELIAHLLRSEGIAPDRATMIGDRAQDMLGARQNGVRALGVLWGYGSRTELEDAGAHQVFSEIPELVAALSRAG